MTISEAERDVELRRAWDRLFESCHHPNAFHSSPAWAEYLATCGVRVRVLVVRDAGDGILGVVALAGHRSALSYEIRSRKLTSSGFNVIDVLGSVPLVPDEPELMRDVVEAAFAAFPECAAIRFESLPVENPWWKLESGGAARWLKYMPSGIQRAHSVELGGSFEEYWRRSPRKFRSNMERAVRRLEQVGGGRLELVCCRALEDVDRFFAEASQVRERSWQRAVLGSLDDDAGQTSKQSLSELARRGLLRSYLLRSGNLPCAFVIGYQYRDVFFYAVIGYDPTFSRHSPGSALLYLLLEDLFSVDRPRFVSFGRGDDDYKRRFGTRQESVGTCLLFRPSRRNRVRVHAHRLFSGMKQLVSGFGERFLKRMRVTKGF